PFSLAPGPRSLRIRQNARIWQAPPEPSGFESRKGNSGLVRSAEDQDQRNPGPGLQERQMDAFLQLLALRDAQCSCAPGVAGAKNQRGKALKVTGLGRRSPK